LFALQCFSIPCRHQSFKLSIFVPFPTTPKEVERTAILSALEDRGLVVADVEGLTAKLDLPRTTPLYKMARFGICRPAANEAALESETGADSLHPLQKRVDIFAETNRSATGIIRTYPKRIPPQQCS
jgi:hypothetical protein